MLALAYSSMRGYGNIHPTLGELRVGYLPLTVRHPVSGEPYVIGEVKITEAEVLARMQAGDGPPKFSLGYGLCFGQNEIKAISMAVLDAAPAPPTRAARPKTRSSSSITPTASRPWVSAITGNCRTMSIFSPTSTACGNPRNWPALDKTGRITMQLA